MTDFSKSKALICEYFDAIQRSNTDTIASVLEGYMAPNIQWRGYHPFNEQRSPADVAEVFWKPLKRSFSAMQRRQDVFMAGFNDCDNFQGEWVVSMGKIMGLFDADFLHIPATHKTVFLPYCEFNRIENGKITETAMFVDLIALMRQAGVDPIPMQTAGNFLNPGPATQDGLMFAPQDAAVGKKTLDLINTMIADLSGPDSETPAIYSPPEELRRTWHEDMCWFGPAGIGGVFTIERYDEQHQRPFNEGLTDRVYNGHVARLGEGQYGGFFGWANISMKSSGGFLGMTASDHQTEMRVIDIYRREGDKLAENWIFIDLLHFLNLQGLDVLGRLKEQRHIDN